MQLYSTGRRNTGLAQTQRAHRHIARRSYARPGKCIGASDEFVLYGQKKEQLPKGDCSTGTERAPFSNRVGVNGVLPRGTESPTRIDEGCYQMGGRLERNIVRTDIPLCRSKRRSPSLCLPKGEFSKSNPPLYYSKSIRQSPRNSMRWRREIAIQTTKSILTVLEEEADNLPCVR
jgi:hypothetical protein